MIETLAQIERATKLFKSFSDRPRSQLLAALAYLVIIAILVVVAALILRRLWRALTQPNPHLRLFVQLVNVHELSDLEARALRRIARQANLGNPAWLFVDRSFLQKELNLFHDPIVAGLYSKIFGN